MKEKISLNNFSDLLGVSRATVDKWVSSGKFAVQYEENGKGFLLNR